MGAGGGSGGLAQIAQRNHAAVAPALDAVEHQEVQVPVQGSVLEAVVQQQAAGAGGKSGGEAGTLDPAAGDHHPTRTEPAGHQDGLVPGLFG